MSHLRTPRLTLHPIDPAEGERIVARRPGPQDVWAADFPFDGDVIGVTAFLRTAAAQGDPRPFGHYRITRTADGQAVGGIGFKGSPTPTRTTTPPAEPSRAPASSRPAPGTACASTRRGSPAAADHAASAGGEVRGRPA